MKASLTAFVSLRASFSCEREKPNAPCSPLSDLQVEFSAPVDAKAAASARLVLPDGTRSPQLPIPGGRESTVGSLSFKRPFPQNAELKIELPAALKDEAGRPLANAASFPLSRYALACCRHWPSFRATSGSLN